jgi:hypothetical protein
LEHGGRFDGSKGKTADLLQQTDESGCKKNFSWLAAVMQGQAMMM